MADTTNLDQNSTNDSGLLQFSEDMTEESITEKLKGCNDKWQKVAETLYPKFTSYYKFYRDQEYSMNGQMVKVPIVFTTIEIEKPFLLNNLFSQSDIVAAEAKFDDPNNQQTDRVKAYVNDLITKKNNGRDKTLQYITNFLIYGFSVVKAFWNTKPDKEINPLTKMAIDVPSSHADFYNVDPFSFAFDTDKEVDNIQELDWVRERIFITKNNMKEMRDAGLCGNFEDEDMNSIEDKGKKTRHPGQNSEGGTFYDEFYIKLHNKSHVQDEEGNDTGESKTESKEYRVWLLANNKIIKLQENIFGMKPYAVSSPYPLPFSVIGMGEPEVIGGIANRYSINNYQAGLLASKIGKSPYLIGPNSGLMPYNTSLTEEGLLFSKDINDVKPLPSIDPENLEALIKFGEYLQEEVESTTGVTKTLQGVDLGDITATQAQILEQMSVSRLAIKLEQLQEKYIVPLATMLFLLTKQNISLPQILKGTNNELLTLQPQDFFGNYTWESTSPITISNKALALQNNISLIEQMAKASQASQNTPWAAVINYVAAMQDLVQPNLNVPNILKYFVPVSSIQQQQQAPVAQGPQQLAPGQNAPVPNNAQSPNAPPPPLKAGPTPFNSGPVPASSPAPISAPIATPHPGFIR